MTFQTDRLCACCVSNCCLGINLVKQQFKALKVFRVFALRLVFYSASACSSTTWKGRGQSGPAHPLDEQRPSLKATPTIGHLHGCVVTVLKAVTVPRPMVNPAFRVRGGHHYRHNRLKPGAPYWPRPRSGWAILALNSRPVVWNATAVIPDPQPQSQDHKPYPPPAFCGRGQPTSMAQRARSPWIKWAIHHSEDQFTKIWKVSERDFRTADMPTRTVPQRTAKEYSQLDKTVLN
jgi:hypothetical protein